MIYYRIEWDCKNGEQQFTLANTEEKAKAKSKQIISRKDVVVVQIIKCEEIDIYTKFD